MATLREGTSSRQLVTDGKLELPTDEMDLNIFFPFGRKPIMRGNKQTTPIYYVQKPCGWPHMEFKSFKPKVTKLPLKEIPIEEQFDKFAPVEKTIDTDCLVKKYVALMNELEKSNVTMCCEGSFFGEGRRIEKSIVPRRPNCPRIWPTNDLKMFGSDAAKPQEANKLKSITSDTLYKKPKNPFDRCTDDVYPKVKPFVIPTNRPIEKPRVKSMGVLQESGKCCGPSTQVNTYCCH